MLSDATTWRLHVQVERGENLDEPETANELLRARRRKVLRPLVQVKVCPASLKIDKVQKKGSVGGWNYMVNIEK